jgi:tetratricopeptide (TPR) repeat protein
MFHLVRAEHKQAVSLAERIEEIGEAGNDVAAQLRGRLLSGITHFFLGELVVARALFERCHGLSDLACRTAYAAPGDLAVVRLGYLGLTLTYLGYIDQGRSQLKEALHESRRLQHAFTLASSLHYCCWLEWIANSPAEAQRYAAELIAFSNDQGFPDRLGWGLCHNGWSLSALGYMHEDVAAATTGLSVYRATGAVGGTPFMLVLLAGTLGKNGRPVEGLNCLVEAEHIIETTAESREEVELHRLRGDLLNATGDRAGAEQSYRQALAVAQWQSAKVFELRAATSLARLWSDQGKRTEARDLLAPVYNWFTEGFDTPVLQGAKLLLEQLSA